MEYHSILFDKAEGSNTPEQPQPDFLHDLNLDKVIDAVIGIRDEYNIRPFFYSPLNDPATVRYRQDICRELEENTTILESLKTFGNKMRRMHAYLHQIERMFDRYEREIWFVEAVDIYCEAVTSLAEDFALVDLRSAGLQSFRDYIRDYITSNRFASLAQDVASLRNALSTVEYCTDISGARVTVSGYNGEPDYSEKVRKTFAKFQEGAARDYSVTFQEDIFEPRILEGVARLYPDLFNSLDNFYLRHRDFRDKKVIAFDREVHFYIAYLTYIRKFASANLAMCYPEVSAHSKELHAEHAYDIALADKLLGGHSPVVCNSFFLSPPERILVVTGPNQAGKTTFARMFGQLHYLASLGLPVPARDARLPLPDRIFTHFEREENIESLRGKLEDELERLHEVLGQATCDSVIIMNESFTSTTLNDALFLGKEVLTRILAIGALCVYVTFVDELTSLSPSTVSMVGTVDPEDPAIRTYKIVRRPADGLAYAAAIARKYGLTYDSLRKLISL